MRYVVGLSNFYFVFQTSHCKRFNIAYHVYADGTHTSGYDPKVPDDFDEAQGRLTDCNAEVKVWILWNKLRLKDSKTAFGTISSPGN